jgi:predicted 2-oxoglutarate/Fe(II)-dependent dioxygenase YbiX
MYENADDLLDEIAKKYYVGELDITGGWFQQYYKSDTHNWHFHGNSNLSCVYYIELYNSKDSTIFYDIENNSQFQLDVKEGDVVIFPSHTIHKSPLLKSNNRKTIISLNISFKKVDTTYINIDK